MSAPEYTEEKGFFSVSMFNHHPDDGKVLSDSLGRLVVVSSTYSPLRDSQPPDNDVPIITQVTGWLTEAGWATGLVYFVDPHKARERSYLEDVIVATDPGIIVTLGKSPTSVFVETHAKAGMTMAEFFVYQQKGRFRLVVPYPHPDAGKRVARPEGYAYIQQGIDLLKKVRANVSHDR